MRMQCLQAALFLVLALLNSVLGLTCSKTRVRKEIRDITAQEFDIFVKALHTYNTKSSNGISKYDEWVKVHVDAATRAHGVPAFLPWHRYYVWKLEEELLKIDSRVVIPYWDWSLDSQAPEVSIIFLDSLFGGNGRANDSCVTNGRFKDWKVAYPNPSCLKRNFDGVSKLSAFYATEQIDLIVQGSGTYDAFRQALEGAPHGTPHNNIGGFMATMHSSNDPIFWLHHGFIDKLWHDFQSRQGKRRLYSAQSNLQENLPPFDVTVEQVLDISELCYSYAEPSTLKKRLNVTQVPPTSDKVNSSISASTTKPSMSMTTPTTTVSATPTTNPTTLSSTTINLPITSSSTTLSKETQSSTTKTSDLPMPTSSDSDFPIEPIGSFLFEKSHEFKRKRRINWIPRKYNCSTSNPPVIEELIVLLQKEKLEGKSCDCQNSTSYFEKIVKQTWNPEPLDRSYGQSVRIPKPVPSSWLTHMNVDVSSTRVLEQSLANVMSYYNKQNMVSVSAPYIVNKARNKFGEKTSLSCNVKIYIPKLE